MGLDFSASDGMEASVPHICPRTLRAYVGREELPVGIDFDLELACPHEAKASYLLGTLMWTLKRPLTSRASG